MHKQILVFYRRGALGDTLFTFPALEILKKKDFYIIAIGNSEYFTLAKLVNWIDETYSDFYPHFIKKLPPDTTFYLFTRAELPFLKSFTNVFYFPPFPEKRMWMVDYYLKVLNLKEVFSRALPLSVSYNSSSSSKHTKIAVIHPGSGSRKKVPPFEFFEKIEKFLLKNGYQVVYFLGTAEESLELLLKNAGKKFFKSREIFEVAKFLKSAEVFVGVDSGISHLAAYLGIKSFVFFGPSDTLMWKPIGLKVKVISLNLKCSPCFPDVCEKRECLNPDLLFKEFLKHF
jgi:ADP-heptose:LPS heptosyltransferase